MLGLLERFDKRYCVKSFRKFTLQFRNGLGKVRRRKNVVARERSEQVTSVEVLVPLFVVVNY